MAKPQAIHTTIIWEGRTIRLSYTPRWCTMIDHVEIEVDDRTPLPITETGYRSHFFGPVEPQLIIEEVTDMVTGWLDKDATKRSWRDYLKQCEADKQLTMF